VYLNVAYRGRCVEPLYNENRIRGLEWDEKLQKQALKLYGGYAGRSEDAVDELRTALEGIIAQVMREAK
jgi:histone H3/H4